jgi:hypothetical protein
VNAHDWTRAALLIAVLAGTPRPALAQADAAAGGTPEADRAELAGRLEAMVEQLQILQADTDKLKKFKLSGYVQARWETGEAKLDSARVSGSPPVATELNNERFYIRRGRLKLTYDSSPLSQAVVYFDGGSDRTLRLLEAYVTLLDPWTPLHQHQLTIGQFNVPFGYEIERSSSARELPERSRAENVLFAGERDRGIKVASQWTPQVETVVAVLNGGGVNHRDFPNADPTRAKDLLGRVRFAQGRVDGAVSYYHGRNLTPLSGDDVENDKTRLGFDAQGYYELPILGGGTVRAELFLGREVNPDSVRALTTTTSNARLLRPGADPAHFASDMRGGYAMWVQNLGERFQLALRYDAFDPNTDLPGDEFERLGVGASWFFDGFVRVTVAYDAPRTHPAPASQSRYDALATARGADPTDNLWTVQVQHKF